MYDSAYVVGIWDKGISNDISKIPSVHFIVEGKADLWTISIFLVHGYKMFFYHVIPLLAIPYFSGNHFYSPEVAYKIL